MDDLFHLFDLCVRHDLLYIPLNRDNSWDFNDSFDNLLDYLWNFDDLMINLEAFKNVLDISSVRNLLIDHGYDGLVDFGSVSCLLFHSLKFLQECLQKDPLMELNSFLLISIVGIDIFDLDKGGHEFNYLNNFIHTIVVN